MKNGDRIALGVLRAGRVVITHHATLVQPWMETEYGVHHSHFTVTDVDPTNSSEPDLPGQVHFPYHGTVICALENLTDGG